MKSKNPPFSNKQLVLSTIIVFITTQIQENSQWNQIAPKGLISVVKLQPASFSSMKYSCPGQQFAFTQVPLRQRQTDTKEPRNANLMRRNARKRWITEVAIKSQDKRICILQGKKMPHSTMKMMEQLMQWTSILEILYLLQVKMKIFL